MVKKPLNNSQDLIPKNKIGQRMSQRPLKTDFLVTYYNLIPFIIQVVR